MCPYYLDGDRTEHGHEAHVGSVIPVETIARERTTVRDRAVSAITVATVQFSRTVERSDRWADGCPRLRGPLPPDGRRSLKTQQHAGHASVGGQESAKRSSSECRPGSVDVLGPASIGIAVCDRVSGRGTNKGAP